jgi:hypothetical protein
MTAPCLGSPLPRHFLVFSAGGFVLPRCGTSEHELGSKTLPHHTLRHGCALSRHRQCVRLVPHNTHKFFVGGFFRVGGFGGVWASILRPGRVTAQCAALLHRFLCSINCRAGHNTKLKSIFTQDFLWKSRGTSEHGRLIKPVPQHAKRHRSAAARHQSIAQLRRNGQRQS